MDMKRLLTVLLVASVALSCGRTSSTPAPAASSNESPSTSLGTSRAPNPESRKYLLERVDDAAVVQYYADGFEKLPLRLAPETLRRLRQTALVAPFSGVAAPPPAVLPFLRRAVRQRCKVSFDYTDAAGGITSRSGSLGWSWCTPWMIQFMRAPRPSSGSKWKTILCSQYSNRVHSA